MNSINIIGFGLMGKQIATLFYLMGFHVNVYTSKNNHKKDLNRQVKLLNRVLHQDEHGQIEFYNEIKSLPNTITIESVKEDLLLKKEIYNQVRLNNTCEYFSNTSSYIPTEIAEDVNGLHFFNPIHLKLVEVYLTKKASDAINVITQRLIKTGFNILEVNENRGYIGNFILFHEISSILKLIDKHNYNSGEILSVYEILYGKRDVFAIIDIIGVDTTYQILNNLKEIDDGIYVPEFLNNAIKANILGKKNKTSIKDYIDER